uniref:Fibronectin type-III domain-containing protein n=1 Tax=Cyprinus carpio TaxID=7962 RepID=A0A8C1INH0_CYPCA
MHLAWTAEDDAFDRFVLKVRDSSKLSHPREFVVPGDERTKVLTQLLGGTEYEIELYGVMLEHRSQPITAVARTGIAFVKHYDLNNTLHPKQVLILMHHDLKCICHDIFQG